MGVLYHRYLPILTLIIRLTEVMDKGQIDKWKNNKRTKVRLVNYDRNNYKKLMGLKLMSLLIVEMLASTNKQSYIFR